MALDQITDQTIKGRAINELQSIKSAVLTGTTADTDIPLAGATVKDTTLKSVLRQDATSGVMEAEISADCAITTDGNLQCTADTSGKVLVVEFWNKPTPR